MSVATLARKPQGHAELLRPGEDPFSTNKVTGYSLNFPIINTCRPTSVCGTTCYFAKGPSTWSASLDKQHRLLNSMRADPLLVAEKIVRWALRHRLTFIRWAGGGDMFPEAVQCLDSVASKLPNTPQWVVTRKPEVAALVIPRPNIFVHFSTDRGSMQRLADAHILLPPGLQWFWSYQCDRGEVPPRNDIAPVIFRDSYELNGPPLANDCPLNLSESIVRVCESCRRCFNGEAVKRATECHASQSSSPR